MPARLVRRQLPFRLRVWIPSDKGAINDAVARVLKFAHRCRFPEDRLTDVEIAVREALANAIQHGNRNRPSRKVFLRCYAGPRAGILVAVRDQGNGFDPDSTPDPTEGSNVLRTSGRGLLLIRAFVDEISVSHSRGGTEVKITKRLGSKGRA